MNTSLFINHFKFSINITQRKYKITLLIKNKVHILVL